MLPDIFSIRENTSRLGQPPVNVYFILHGDRGGFLYDAGYSMRRPFYQFLAGISDLFKHLKRTGRLSARLPFKEAITKVYLSHDHHDHSSGAVLLKALFPRCEIVASVQTKSLLGEKAGLERAGESGISAFDSKVQSLLMHLFYGAMDVPDTIHVDEVVRDGDVITTGKYSFTVLLADGHAPGQLLLHEPRHGVLFSSDLLLRTISTWLGPPHSDYRLYNENMHRLLELGLKMVLPAHGGPITAPDARIHELLRFRKLREMQIIKSCENEPLSANDIAWRVYHDRGIKTYLIAKGMVSLVADHLVEEGKLRVTVRDGKKKYAV